ncbi:MAG: molybdopterin-dependent oxidoreductase [Nitrososphaerota archaeon]|nr:molybdopterin-dependent oxidoreductase [Nitrososphaerota archaeon]
MLEIKKSVCMWCHNHCRVEVHVRNGRVEKIEEDKAFPRAELLRPVVRACPRARNVAEWLYHPDQLRYPLKRAGRRGEGKWIRISWDQALDEIADKLLGIKEEYGPEAIATSLGTGRTHDEYRMRFMNLLGSPNNIGQGNICYGPGSMVSLAIYGWPDFYPAVSRSTRCIVLFGANPQQAARGLWQAIVQSVRSGAKLIVVDPRRTAAAEQADIWLQLRPGTDCALYMGMLNVIVNEEIYDKEFVDKWCFGFDKLKTRVQDYPPEHVAKITWIPAEKIREAARTYATTRPGVIIHGMGVEHLSNSVEALHARYILTAITGNLDVKGGEELRSVHPSIRTEYEIELNDKLPLEQRRKQIGVDRFKLMSKFGYELIKEYAKAGVGTAHTTFAHAPSVYRAMISGEPYPVRALITVASNPMVTQANTRLVYRAILSLDLFVVHDFWMTPSAELADYVLPCASWLERPCIFNYWDSIDFVYVSEAAVQPLYERRPDYDLWRGLGIRMGQEEYWPWQTLEEALLYRLKPLGYDSFEELMRETGGIIRPPREEKKYEKVGFGTPTGKVELYSTVFEKLGYDPLPRYYEPPESPVSTPELAKEYPLILITGSRHQPFYHSEFRQIDSLRKQHPDPIVQLNPKTASELGIKDGDWVWIETPRGRVKQKCELFDGIDPRVVNAQHGWWYPEMPGEEPSLHGVWESNINVVTNDDPDQCNMVNGGWPLRALLCKVYKA